MAKILLVLAVADFPNHHVGIEEVPLRRWADDGAALGTSLQQSFCAQNPHGLSQDTSAD
ncbi:MAG: hypothetical protein ABSG36_06230 [Acidimicrobiales bacterium]